MIHAEINYSRCNDMLIDTGSTSNIIAENVCNALPILPTVHKTSACITAFGGGINQAVGVCELYVSYRGADLGTHMFFIVRNAHPPIVLGNGFFRTCEAVINYGRNFVDAMLSDKHHRVQIPIVHKIPGTEPTAPIAVTTPNEHQVEESKQPAEPQPKLISRESPIMNGDTQSDVSSTVSNEEMKHLEEENQSKSKQETSDHHSRSILPPNPQSLLQIPPDPSTFFYEGVPLTPHAAIATIAPLSAIWKATSTGWATDHANKPKKLIPPEPRQLAVTNFNQLWDRGGMLTADLPWKELMTHVYAERRRSAYVPPHSSTVH